MKKQKTMTLQELTQAMQTSLDLQMQTLGLIKSTILAHEQLIQSMELVVTNLLELKIQKVGTKKN